MSKPKTELKSSTEQSSRTKKRKKKRERNFFFHVCYHRKTHFNRLFVLNCCDYRAFIKKMKGNVVKTPENVLPTVIVKNQIILHVFFLCMTFIQKKGGGLYLHYNILKYAILSYYNVKRKF